MRTTAFHLVICTTVCFTTFPVPGFEEKARIKVSTSNQGKFDFTQVSGRGGICVVMPMGQALSGKLSTMEFAGFDAGTVVEIGDGGFSEKRPARNDTAEGTQGEGSLSPRNYQAAILVKPDSVIQVHRDGFIVDNLKELRFSHGRIECTESFQIGEIPIQRSLRINDGKLSVAECSVGDRKAESMIKVGPYEYLDLRNPCLASELTVQTRSLEKNAFAISMGLLAISLATAAYICFAWRRTAPQKTHQG